MEYKGSHTLRDVLYLPLRNRVTIFTVFLAALCASLVYCIVIPAVYRAETKLVFRSGLPGPSELNQYRPASYATDRTGEGNQIARGVELVKGEYLTKKVVERVGAKIEPLRAGQTRVGQTAQAIANVLRTFLVRTGLSKTPNDSPNRMIIAFMDRVNTAYLSDANTISIAFEWTDPRSAALVANTYADEYALQESLTNDSERLREFYERQAEHYSRKLREADERYQTVASTSNAPDVEFQKELLLRNMSELSNRIGNADAEIGVIQTTIGRITEMARKPGSWVQTSGLYPAGRQGYLQSLDQTYLGLKAEKERLQKNRTPDDPEVQAIDARLESLRIQKIDAALQIAGSELSLAQNRRTTLARQLSAEQKKLRAITSNSTPLSEARRAQTMAEENYRTYSKSAEDMRVLNGLEAHKISNVKVLVPAVPPLVPARPRTGLVVLWSAIGGLLLGLILAFLKEFYDHTFKDHHEVTKVLGIPVLLSVPDQARYSPPGIRAAKGNMNGGVARLRRVFGQELRRPLWGSRPTGNGATITLALVLVAVCLLYLYRSSISSRSFGIERVSLPLRSSIEEVSLLSIYPTAWLAGNSAGPSLTVPEQSPLKPESTLLSEELEKQRHDLYRRQEQVEAELLDTRPEGNR